MSLVNSFVDRLRWLGRSSVLRLTALLSLLFAVGMAAVVVIALTLGRAAVIERIDNTLNGIASTLEAEDAPADSFAVIIRPVRELHDIPVAFASVARKGGGTILLEDDYRDSDTWRAIVAQDAEGVAVLIAVPLDDSEDALELLSEILWVTALIVIALVLVVGFGIGLMAQKRIQSITRMLDHLAAGDLQARVGVTRSSDDLDDLAQRLDTTAFALERLMAQSRYLSASIAHDLRTPLARLRGRLEMLPDDEARSAALNEVTHLSEIFDAIMRVAQIEAQQGTDGFEEIDLNSLVNEIYENYAPVVEDSGKTLHLRTANSATILGDKQMLVLAAANLLQNALVHGGQEITLFAQDAAFGVADNGKGVDPDQYDAIVKPMVRLDGARSSQGAGLGLALVRAVADRHRASLVLSPRTPQGLRAAIHFAVAD